MPTVHALFDSYTEATHAVRLLKEHGVDESDISIVANRSDLSEPDKPVAEGAELGANIGGVVGGAGGLLAGLGVLAIPGLGAVVAGGWLVTAAIGMAAGGAAGLAVGGIVGALTEAGVPEDTAHAYAEGIKRGGTLVTVRVDKGEVAEAEAMLDAARRIDVPEQHEHIVHDKGERVEINPRH